jgi:hypothetical protein
VFREMKRAWVILGVVLALVVSVSVVFADSGGVPRVTTLSGAEVVPSGDPDGSGFASIRLNHGQATVCWQISFEGLDGATAAHIHQAPAGQNGGVVLPLSLDAGCTDADQGLIKAIIQNPENYYVQVHSAEFPGGAIRGQLSNRGQSE